MKLASRRLSKAIRQTGMKFLGLMRKQTGGYRFEPSAYYIVIGTVICSMTPHYGWKNARRAAKRFDHRAFIMRGATVNRHIEQSQWKGHKNAWDAIKQGA